MSRAATTVLVDRKVTTILCICASHEQQIFLEEAVVRTATRAVVVLTNPSLLKHPT
jgi:hypothetical protein